MKKPDIFILGDSISIHYGPFLEVYLKEHFNYSRKGYGLNIDFGDPRINGGDSFFVMEYLRGRMAEGFSTDWLLLNAGLHDIKINPATGLTQRTKEEYTTTLSDMVVAAKQCSQHIAWVHSTPVDDEVHKRCPDFQRFNRHVIEYNEVANRIMTDAGFRIIDLYTFTTTLDLDLYEDHVHYTPPVRRLQAAFIAGHLIAWKQQLEQ